MFGNIALTALTAAMIASALSGVVSAQGRPDTRRMTCEQAQEFVHHRGAVVMSTGRFTYERLVRNRSYCDYDENIWQVYAPTRDYRRCRVGNKCVAEYTFRDKR